MAAAANGQVQQADDGAVESAVAVPDDPSTSCFPATTWYVDR